MIRRLLWPILITAAVLLAFVVSGAGQDTRDDLEYLDSMLQQVSDVALSSAAFRDVAGRLSVVDRVEFVTVIDTLRADLARGQELAALEAPAPELVAVNALYAQALDAWQAGVGGFGSAVLVAADDRSDPFVVDHVADALAEMRAGDALYLTLVDELAVDDVPSPTAPMPEVEVMPAEGGLASLSTAYVEAARSPNSGLTLRPGLGLSQLVADPAWVVGPEDEVVLPAVESVTFSVVITNKGNVASGPEKLVLEFTGGPEDVVFQDEIDALRPTEQTTITFDPIPVEVGLAYEVVARLELTGIDSDFEDNVIAVVFTVNEGDIEG